MYPSPEVTELVSEHFIPVRIHIKEQPTMWKRFGVRWTPTVLILDPEGREVHRIEGYLPTDNFLAQLELGLGFVYVAEKKWQEAANEFAQVVRDHPDTDAAPEAMYWEGVSKYSGSHDASALAALTKQFATRYSDTSWAKRASIWKK